MSYRIGIGLLIDAPFYDKIRPLELEIAEATKNYAGLRQPPHVTVKRTFEVDSIADITKCAEIMGTVAEKYNPIPLSFHGVANFNEKVIYMQVAPSSPLRHMHKDLLTALESKFSNARSTLEADEMVFHTTLTMQLSLEQFNIARQIADTLPTDATNFTATAQRIGLFLGIDDNTHWIVLSEQKLGLR